MIQLVQVEKRFAEGQPVVKPLTVDIYEGEFLTILGPSGCGKTTLLRMLAGLEQPTGGEIVLDGRSVTTLPPNKRDMNLVFQSYALFPHMTVEKNVAFGLQMKGLPAADIRSRVDEALRMTELTALKAKYPAELSGGQQQRTAVARAIVNKPKVLLLDEPMAALDLQLRKHLQVELKQLQKKLGTTFVYVTHDQEEAMAMSDRIIVMNDGRVEQVGTPRDIYERPASRFAASFIGDNNVIEREDRCYAVRPEHIRLLQPDAPDRRCTGVIEDVAFLGSHCKVLIRLVDEIHAMAVAQPGSAAHAASAAESVVPAAPAPSAASAPLDSPAPILAYLPAAATNHTNTIVERGERVGLGWDRQHEAVLPV